MKRFLLIVVLLTMLGCAGKIEPERDVKYYIDTGEQYYKAGKYEEAIKAYENALSRAEDPKIAAEIQLAIANTYYADKEFAMSIPVYEIYLDLYPNSTEATDAYLKLGLAHFDIRESANRDITDAVKAIQYFDIVKKRNPNLFFKERLDKKVSTLNDELALKEYKIARYYSRIWQDNSSILRYEYLIETYPTAEIVPLSYYRLIKLLGENNRLDEAKKYLAIFKATFESNEYFKDAVDVLAKEEKRIAKEEAKLKAEEDKLQKALDKVEEKDKALDSEIKSDSNINNLGESK